MGLPAGRQVEKVINFVYNIGNTAMADLQALTLYVSLFISLFFEIFLLITYLEVRGELKVEDARHKKGLSIFPSVTVLVPCYNEGSTVVDTIKSILNLDYPKDKLSVILINDGSTDNTLSELKKFKDHPQVSILTKENGGKASALNYALGFVKSDLVGCLDADSFVTPFALKKIIPHFEDEKVMAVTPSIKVHDPKGFLQLIQKTEYSWGIFLRRMLSSMGALYVTPGPFSIFRVRVFKELGGYRHAHMTEDLEMALRMQKNHYKIVNSHGAHVYTVTPSKLRDLVKQRVRWTYGFINNSFDYKELFFNKNYGNIGLFILPIAAISIFSTLYMVSRVAWSAGASAMRAFERFQAVGFTGQLHFPTFDWYFINTGIMPFLTTTAVALTLVILYLSLKMADGKVRISRGVFYYLFLYTFIVPLWLVRALFDTVFRRKVTWR